MAASRRIYSIINDLSFSADDKFKINGPVLDKFCRKMSIKDFDTTWNPNPITSLDSQYSSIEPDDFDILKPLLDHIVDTMYSSVDFNHRFKPNKENYYGIIKSAIKSNDPAIMCFSGVDWHTDTWSSYPLRVLIPLNTSTLYLFTSELYKTDNTLRVVKSIEYKTRNRCKLERGAVLTFNENCIHMASVLKDPSKNASVCLTLPHPVYGLLDDKERQAFNVAYKQTLLTKLERIEDFEEYEEVKHTRYEWWSSTKNKYVVADLRREFIAKFGGLGYTLTTYDGLTNTPFVEPTTQNAWEAFLIGVDLSYTNNKKSVSYIYPW